MDGDTLELNEFLNQKRKSKRRSSIATIDATIILNCQKDLTKMNFYESIDTECNLQAEWLSKNHKILENYSGLSKELVNRMNIPLDFQINDLNLLSDEQTEFLNKYSLKADFSNQLIRKLERIVIKSEALNANLRVKEFEKLKIDENKNHQIKKRLPICSIIKRPDIEGIQLNKIFFIITVLIYT